MPRRTFLILLALVAPALCLCGTPSARAEVLRIAAWNVREGFTPEKIAARSADFSGFAARVRPDLLIVEEVTSLAGVEAIRDAMGLTGYHVACSDFSPGDAPDFSGFEVGVISRFPITQIIEYDPSPDNAGKPGAPQELPISPLLKIGQQPPPELTQTRGFLWVRIDALKLTAVGVHLKSSRGNDGEEDRANAALREFVAAAVVDSVAQDLRLFPDYTCLVAGDFNVGHSDSKNGVDLNREDLIATATSDGYDETHAMLGGGLLGLKMRNLSGAIRETTFPRINSTPIDNIYVAGAAAEQFAPAVLEMETFGSDHRPVITTWETTPTVNAPPPPNFATGAPPAPKPTATAPAAPVNVVAPADVAKYLNGRCTVEFEVLAANVQPSTPPIGFLNSESDFRSEQNFTAVVFEEGLKKFEAAGIADFAAHFQNRRIRVTGQVSQRRERYQIIVADPQQIEVLK